MQTQEHKQQQQTNNTKGCILCTHESIKCNYIHNATTTNKQQQQNICMISITCTLTQMHADTHQHHQQQQQLQQQQLLLLRTGYEHSPHRSTGETRCKLPLQLDHSVCSQR